MRKLFWGCTTCGVLLAGGAISTAHFAAHHPTSVIGRVLTGASYAASVLNPVGGLAPVVAHARTAAAVAAGEPAPVAVPEEPAPATEEEHPLTATTLPPLPMGEDLVSKPAAAGPVVTHPEGAPIVIPEDDGPAACPTEAVMPAAFSPAAECPQGPGAAPLTMPGAEAELLPLPTEVSPEVLPAPKEEAVPEGDEPTPGEEESGPAKEAKAAPDDGPRASPCTPPCGPRCPSAAPEPNTVSHRSALKKVHLFTRPAGDEGAAPHPEVDTMEYRPSDRRLYEYGPGSL
jgi:hypothetical protein